MVDKHNMVQLQVLGSFDTINGATHYHADGVWWDKCDAQTSRQSSFSLIEHGGLADSNWFITARYLNVAHH